MTKNKMKKFREKNDPICHYCHKFIANETEITVDHKKAKARGGSNSVKNLVIACLKCNQEKGNMNERQYNRYKKYKEKLREMTFKELEVIKLEFKEKLKTESIKNGKELSFLTIALSRKMKAINYIMREKGGKRNGIKETNGN